MKEFTGCDDFRHWLEKNGFTIGINGLAHRDNPCNWHAYRRSALPARECECNTGKPLQIVVTPFEYQGHRSSEMDVTGEASGIWYKLCAYSMKQEELQEKLEEIEKNLVAAWNALGDKHD